eukprot:TRINITY_DN12476_c0_g2_i10.p3 TRINITY_DN12476_c0_g2~~TRINITY_DN12476_c0_g2_i10.p3  ORF type:complete len:143 (-),score=5.09 TRINITY_DN12476_c0_g2_i10:197-625(-)
MVDKSDIYNDCNYRFTTSLKVINLFLAPRRHFRTAMSIRIKANFDVLSKPPTHSVVVNEYRPDSTTNTMPSDLALALTTPSGSVCSCPFSQTATPVSKMRILLGLSDRKGTVTSAWVSIGTATEIANPLVLLLMAQVMLMSP